MAAALILGFLGAALVVVWAFSLSVAGQVHRWLRTTYLVALSVAVIAAYFTTFHYNYYADADTRFHGWPIPTVVFQRSGPDEPWLDFVGPTVILAYPMNLILFLVLPSVVVVVLTWRAGNLSTKSKDVG